LRHWARLRPDQTAFTQLLGAGDRHEIDFQTLAVRVTALASRLRESGCAGKAVVLVYPTGIDFVIAFLACLSAGAIAVPSELPRRRGKSDRLQAILQDSGAAALLVDRDLSGRFRDNGDLADLVGDRLVFEVGESDQPHRQDFPATDVESLALLQYTSGSTAAPRGVMISHGALLANVRMISAAFQLTRHDRSGSWLPAHHDMGLVGGILTTLLWGEPGLLLSPSVFLSHPLAWLRAISDHGITVTGGPDFAYRWCVERIPPDEVATLDLSRWRVAFTGAEIVRPSTLRRFAEHFAPAGFRAEAFFPCYGLAEATLLVSGGPCGEIITSSFDAGAMQSGLVRPADPGAGRVREFVASGRPAPGVELAIVDPATCLPQPHDHTGEIWVRSPALGSGYRGPTAPSGDPFAATLTGDLRPWLRTGDLGFVQDGRLFVSGRCKDLLIVRGAKHAPEDLERTLEEEVAGLVPGGIAVFSVDREDHESIAILAERARNAGIDPDTQIAEMRRALVAAHDLSPGEIRIVKPGSLPRTSSGKIRRFACRELLESGILSPLAASRTTSVDRSETFARIAARLRIPAGNLPLSTRLDADLGLDSLGRMQLLHELAHASGLTLPDGAATRLETLGDLLALLEMAPPSPGAAAAADFREFPEIVQFGKTRSALLAEGYDDPYFRIYEDLGGGRTRCEGREFVQFGSYHYLGLSRHPEVVEAASRAARQVGTSAGASRLVTGNRAIHVELETAIAGFLGSESALAFVGGHATNETVIGHLFGPGDLILHDSLAHNSLIEGAKLSGARRWAFPHNDFAALDDILTRHRGQYRRVLLVVEGVYSMDGDIPDLLRLVELKRRHGALLMLDEAHSLGTLGATGRGLTEHAGVPVAEIDLLMGTLSKAFASCGGFIAGSRDLIEYLRHTTPGFVYSVGMPPASAAAACAAIGLLQREPWRVERLHQNSRSFHAAAATRGIAVGGEPGTPVIPFLTGHSLRALTLSSQLEAGGFVVPPVLHPAVPEEGARLRFFLTCEHREEQIHEVLEALAGLIHPVSEQSRSAVTRASLH
jgi:8-amino-7-oxononanoate synthase